MNQLDLLHIHQKQLQVNRLVGGAIMGAEQQLLRISQIWVGLALLAMDSRIDPTTALKDL